MPSVPHSEDIGGVAVDDAILVSQSLRRLVAAGAIQALQPVRPEQVQPSSLDLRLGARVWQLQCSFLPGAQGLERKLGRLATAQYRADRDEPLVLHAGGVYLAELEEVLELPAGVRGRTNPKSSTGRLDVFVRVLTEHGFAFDTIPDGYRGRLFLEITPQSFHVAVRRGDCLAQLRLATGQPGLRAEELEARQADTPLCSWTDGSPAPVADEIPPGVLLSVDLDHQGGGSGPVGYMARRHMPPIDLARRNLPIGRYWVPLPPAGEHGHVLEPEQFYIFATRERLRIPPDLCAELVPFDATKGELRTHYAGFIDSGFGWADGDPQGGPGALLVLEIRTHDVPFLLEHGQPLFRVEFMRNEAHPDVLYGGSGSNYQMQGLKLAKQFG
ncbi:MAG: 2'-deoxycytidine 5'-triphosphate deaminase [Alphaproteobacteria bacterium]|nr:2'-deoxycytidine 5'-triphosphate deaminase [Alphaproteobacteria bacterium]